MNTPAVNESFTAADLAIVPPPQASPIVLLKGDVVARIDDIAATAEVMSVTDVSMSAQRCTECGGRGIVYIDVCRWYTCPECGGSGYVTTDDEEVEE